MGVLASVGKSKAVLLSIVVTLVCIFLSYFGVIFLLEKNTGIKPLDKWIRENDANSEKKNLSFLHTGGLDFTFLT